MAIQTLEQLKEENAKAEAEANRDPQNDDAEVDTGEAEDEFDDDESADTDSDSEDSTEVEPWMQSDEDESDTAGHDAEDKRFSSRDVAAARRNYGAKLSRRHEKELQERDARIAELEAKVNSNAATPITGKAAKPQRDDFDDEDAFLEALTDWKIATNAASQHAESERAAQRRKVEQYEQETAAAVEKHYERAAELAGKSKIKPETYQAADLKVREMVEEVFPDAGDEVTDGLIATLGEGSERVMYNLGVNLKRRNELRELLEADKTGLKASAYLGRLNAELSSPGKKKQSSAPAPARTITGDAAKPNASAKALRRRYKEAHAKGDRQTAFNARREARSAGIDVSDW